MKHKTRVFQNWIESPDGWEGSGWLLLDGTSAEIEDYLLLKTDKHGHPMVAEAMLERELGEDECPICTVPWEEDMEQFGCWVCGYCKGVDEGQSQ